MKHCRCCCVALHKTDPCKSYQTRRGDDSQSEGRPALVRPSQLSVTAEDNTAVQYIIHFCAMNFFQIHTLKYILLSYDWLSSSNTEDNIALQNTYFLCITVKSVLQCVCHSTLHYYTNCALCSICIVECSGNLTGISGLLLLGRVRRTIPKPLQHSFVLWWSGDNTDDDGDGNIDQQHYLSSTLVVFPFSNRVTNMKVSNLCRPKYSTQRPHQCLLRWRLCAIFSPVPFLPQWPW